MTPTPLTGFIIHSRPYQEKRAIYQVFSLEWGIIHGVGKHGLPPFVLLEMVMTGKTALKTLKQIYIKEVLPLTNIGQNQYALFYLNELIYKLIALENPCPPLWHRYQKSMAGLKTAGDLTAMKQILRQFERTLFDELGVNIDWVYDNRGRAIDPDGFYEFIPNTGFVRSPVGFLGETILATCDGRELNTLGQIHRQLIDFLLDYQPLNSRKLWVEQLKYR